MPQMGYDMQEGTVVKWLKSAGDEISVGDVIAEIETDKAVVEFESPTKGQISELLVEEGQTIEVGKPIATIDDGENEQISELTEKDSPTVSIQEAPLETEEPDSNHNEDDQQLNPSVTTTGIKASPIAKRLANERGIDLINVIGTGPGGRITKTDILNHSSDVKPKVVLEKPSQLTELIQETPVEVEPEG